MAEFDDPFRKLGIRPPGGMGDGAIPLGGMPLPPARQMPTGMTTEFLWSYQCTFHGSMDSIAPDLALRTPYKGKDVAPAALVYTRESGDRVVIAMQPDNISWLHDQLAAWIDAADE